MSNVDDLVGVKFNQVEGWSVVVDIENEAYYDLPSDKDVKKGIQMTISIRTSWVIWKA